MSESKQLSATIRISGMTCGSCELLLERKLKAIPGVLAVNVNYRKGIATITAEADALPSSDLVEETIRKAGYGVDDEPAQNAVCPVAENGILAVCIDGMTSKDSEHVIKKKLKHVLGVKSTSIQYQRGTAKIHYSQLPDWNELRDAVDSAGYRLRRPDEAPTAMEASGRKWVEIGASLLLIFAIYKLLQTFDLVSLAPSTSGALSLGGIFVIGLVAGTSSCLAVTGGLLLALAAKHNELHQAETSWEKFKPLLHFNIGRLVSYFVLGGLVGVIGQSVTLSTKMSGYMSISVAFIMLWLALTILQIIPKGGFPIRPPKKLSRWIHNLSESDHPAAPFALGAFTFFLPCGFTQSLQLVALASGSFLTGALTMFIFALGTLPSLVGLSAISSTAKGTTSRLFLRFSGALVLVLAFFNLSSGFALTGFNFPSFPSDVPATTGSAPAVIGGVQEVAMAVTRYGYQPSNLTIKAGVPVRWKIDGTQAYGCTSQIVIPDLGVTKSLAQGENIVEFTAPNPGRLAFSCSMGMVRGSFTVL
jgi:sulfite exporter TauE/SafE/copper chaperone CopZ/plastocyanin